jgi:hypothetical protein
VVFLRNGQWIGGEELAYTSSLARQFTPGSSGIRWMPLSFAATINGKKWHKVVSALVAPSQ